MKLTPDEKARRAAVRREQNAMAKLIREKHRQAADAEIARTLAPLANGDSVDRPGELGRLLAGTVAQSVK